jgi:hypothetical protein
MRLIALALVLSFAAIIPRVATAQSCDPNSTANSCGVDSRGYDRWCDPASRSCCTPPPPNACNVLGTDCGFVPNDCLSLRATFCGVCSGSQICNNNRCQGQPAQPTEGPALPRAGLVGLAVALGLFGFVFARRKG